MKINVTLTIDEDAIRAESQQENLQDAINQELGWLYDSGMFVDHWSFDAGEQAKTNQPLTINRTIEGQEIAISLTAQEMQQAYDLWQEEINYRKIRDHLSAYEEGEILSACGLEKELYQDWDSEHILEIEDSILNDRELLLKIHTRFALNQNNSCAATYHDDLDQAKREYLRGWGAAFKTKEKNKPSALSVRIADAETRVPNQGSDSPPRTRANERG